MSQRVGICEDCGHSISIGLSHRGPAAPCGECGGLVDILMRRADGGDPRLPKDFHHHHHERTRRKDPSMWIGLAVAAALLLMAGGLYLIK